MAEITAELVRQLREETGAGMMECKKALTEANGDLEEARTVLRKKFKNVSDKREGRTASEGVIAAYVDESGATGVLVELNCETDFVARNADFRNLAHEITQQIARADKPESYPSVEALLSAKSLIEGAQGQTVGEIVTEISARLGEKIAISRFARIDAAGGAGAVGAYLHRTDFKTGVLVEVKADGKPTSLEPVTELAREVAMHVAALKPTYLSREEVPAAVIDKEREIAQARADADPSFANKPEAARTAMIDGQVRKYLEQSVLLEQGFVRDPSGKQKVSALAELAGRNAGTKAHIARFLLFKVGQSAEASA